MIKLKYNSEGHYKCPFCFKMFDLIKNRTFILPIGNKLFHQDEARTYCPHCKHLVAVGSK